MPRRWPRRSRRYSTQPGTLRRSLRSGAEAGAMWRTSCSHCSSRWSRRVRQCMAGNPLVGVRSESRGGVVRWLTRVLATVGLITVLSIATPVVAWWARAYSDPLQQPKGDVLILLSAANDDRDVISYSSYWRARYALIAWQNGGFQK